MQGLQYIDIFDDALYEPSHYVSAPEEYGDLHNTIRLQILVTLLFQNQVIVPEQWAVSSLPFLRIANEVISGYKREIQVKRDDGPMEPDIANPPIVVSFWNREKTSKDQLALAMYSRLISGRRLGLTSALCEVENGNSTQERENLAKIFASLSEEQSKYTIYSDRIVDSIRKEIGNNTVALYIRNLSEYLMRYPDAVDSHDPSGYSEALARQVQSVRHVCFNDGSLIEEGGIILEEFRDFFLESERLKIGPSEIARMWEVARNYSEDSYHLITKMGQYCMHRSMSEKISANYDSTFYGSFGQGRRSVLDEKIVNSIRKRDIEENNFLMKYRDLQFLATEHATRYDLYDKFDWPSIWNTVSEFTRSAEWRRTLVDIRTALREVEADEVHQNAVWRRTFDRMNERMTSFTFRNSQKYEGFAEVLVNLIKDARDTAVMSSTGSPQFAFLIPFSMLAALAAATVKMTPFEIKLEATRNYRRARHMFSNK